MNPQDKAFIKTFSLVIGGLAAFAIVLLYFAQTFQSQVPREASEARLEAVERRIAPVGAVRAGEAGKRALAALTEGPTADERAEAEPLGGEQVYQNVCAACHDTGVGGAPRLEPEAWTARLEQGTDTLYEHSIEGFQGDAGFMPAKGGRADLSDAEVREAVDYMVAEVQEGN